MSPALPLPKEEGHQHGGYTMGPHEAACKPWPRDPGLQAERTALAWSRTGLAMLVNALLALRAGWTGREAPITALGLVLLLASGAIIFYGAWRRRQLLSGQAALAPSAHAVMAVAVVTLLACAVAIASVQSLTGMPSPVKFGGSQ
ncbi:DUF202 domain-containing protein [Pantoea sp. 18069]|uniref:DUF202 domain-containing protein n=1 Tax=Pantoea sp. 18069 TaxID=2681415 RepID=UPI00135CA005|nr:DUF202 domain-containing protein [Pantoea sp. 18069]